MKRQLDCDIYGAFDCILKTGGYTPLFDEACESFASGFGSSTYCFFTEKARVNSLSLSLLFNSFLGISFFLM